MTSRGPTFFLFFRFVCVEILTWNTHFCCSLPILSVTKQKQTEISASNASASFGGGIPAPFFSFRFFFFWKRKSGKVCGPLSHEWWCSLLLLGYEHCASSPMERGLPSLPWMGVFPLSLGWLCLLKYFWTSQTNSEHEPPVSLGGGLPFLPCGGVLFPCFFSKTKSDKVSDLLSFGGCALSPLLCFLMRTLHNYKRLTSPSLGGVPSPCQIYTCWRNRSLSCSSRQWPSLKSTKSFSVHQFLSFSFGTLQKVRMNFRMAIRSPERKRHHQKRNKVEQGPKLVSPSCLGRARLPRALFRAFFCWALTLSASVRAIPGFVAHYPSSGPLGRLFLEWFTCFFAAVDVQTDNPAVLGECGVLFGGCSPATISPGRPARARLASFSPSLCWRGLIVRIYTLWRDLDWPSSGGGAPRPRTFRSISNATPIADGTTGTKQPSCSGAVCAAMRQVAVRLLCGAGCRDSGRNDRMSLYAIREEKLAPTNKVPIQFIFIKLLFRT